VEFEKIYRELLEGTEYKLRPGDIDAMTMNQLRLYFKPQTYTYTQIVDIIKRKRMETANGK
jgi:hypothetical protein